MHSLTHQLDRLARMLTIIALLMGTFPLTLLADAPTGEPTPPVLPPPPRLPHPMRLSLP